MGRIDEHQIDRLIDRVLSGEPIPRGVLMMALLCCEARCDEMVTAESVRPMPDPGGAHMRGMISPTCTPHESVLLAAEQDMCAELAAAERCHREGDTAGEARHLARLHALVEQAAELVGRAA